jgi:hypothetical protein
MTVLISLNFLIGSNLKQVEASSAVIENIKVELNEVNGNTSVVLKKRMKKSIGVVAKQLFVNQDTKSIAKIKPAYEELLKQVGDRAFTGYKVNKLTLVLGKTTLVKVVFEPWAKPIKEVRTELIFSGISESVAKKLRKEFSELAIYANNTLVGASIDSTSWAAGVVRAKIKDVLNKKHPYFKASVDLSRKDDVAELQIIIYPVGQLVTDTQTTIRSDVVPNILFRSFRDKYVQKVNELRGLPVSYVQQNLAKIKEELENELKEERIIKVYELKPVVTIIPGTDFIVNANIGSDKYKVWIEGYMNTSRDKKNLTGKLHLGKYISPKEEIFIENEIDFDEMDAEFALGYTRKYNKLSISYLRYLTDEKENDFRLEYDFNKSWRLRAERFTSTDLTEIGLRYRIQEYFSTEYVYSNDKSYLRFIVNM